MILHWTSTSIPQNAFFAPDDSVFQQYIEQLTLIESADLLISLAELAHSVI